MGIPFFYRFLKQKYPFIVSKISLKSHQSYTNIYFDCNGILHPICSSLSSEPQMIANFLAYINKKLVTLQPKKKIFLSLDGIAPYAKMKQQRVRRYRGSWTKKNMKKIEKKYQGLLVNQGFILSGAQYVNEWDSNMISPGTCFMYKVEKALIEWAKKKINELDEGVEIIISGSNVVGEGEQKIIDYIRNERSKETVNESHCLVGLDADFILLALTLHEPHIYIYREKKERRPVHTILSIFSLRLALAKEFCNPNLPYAMDMERVYDDFVFFCSFFGNDFIPSLPFLNLLNDDLFILIDVYKEFRWISKEYLINREILNLPAIELFLKLLSKYEMKYLESIKKSKKDKSPPLEPKKKLTPDELNEKVIKDFDNSKDIFVKNIPFLTGKDIKEMREFFTQFGEILQINPVKKGCFIRFADQGSFEKAMIAGVVNLFGRSLTITAANVVNELKCSIENVKKDVNKDQVVDLIKECGKIKNFKFKPYQKSCDVEYFDKNSVDDLLKHDNDDINGVTIRVRSSKYINHGAYKKKLERLENVFERNLIENSSLGRFEDYLFDKKNYKKLFYKKKMGENIDLDDLKKNYLKGLKWVMQYYFTNKCSSWRWFYPYDYAPFISDLKVDFTKLSYKFEKDEPFKPLSQLTLILPKESKSLLPIPYQKAVFDNPLFEKYFDTNNLRFDYYGMNGEKVFSEWCGIAILEDDIDYKDILKNLKEDSLSKEEKERNSLKRNWLISRTKIEEFDITAHEDNHYLSVLFPGVKKPELPWMKSNIFIKFRKSRGNGGNR